MDASTPVPPAPVVWLKSDRNRPPEDGLAMALSGGGTRAMMFHAGALLRLYEMGVLSDLKRISGVSGGSITAGVLALKWAELLASASATDRSAVFMASVIEPLRVFARQRTDIFAWIRGTFTPGSSPPLQLAAALDKHLYHGAQLADLPDDPPRFVFNSTNLATGVLWRFSKPYMADYRLGRVLDPKLPLATAVAASSAFPPFFSPLKLRVDPNSYKADDNTDEDASTIDPKQLPKFRERPHLGDGGIYDNLALETVWKRYRDVLVSDGGGGYSDDARPPTDLIIQTVRVMKTIDRQVRALRRSLVVRSYQEPEGPGAGWRRGAYWGVRTRIADYKLADALPCPAERTAVLANEATRLWRMKETTQERLVNWGYAVCDAAVRSFYRPGDPPLGFPYPKAKV